jgi:hypothetical protein
MLRLGRGYLQKRRSHLVAFVPILRINTLYTISHTIKTSISKTIFTQIRLDLQVEIHIVDEQEELILR